MISKQRMCTAFVCYVCVQHLYATFVYSSVCVQHLYATFVYSICMLCLIFVEKQTILFIFSILVRVDG